MLILLIAAFVCFVIAAFAPSLPARPALVPAGLALWVLTVVISAGQHLNGG